MVEGGGSMWKKSKISRRQKNTFAQLLLLEIFFYTFYFGRNSVCIAFLSFLLLSVHCMVTSQYVEEIRKCGKDKVGDLHGAW